VGRGLTVHGLVTDPQGQPIAGAEVTRPRDLGLQRERTTRTGDDGRFTLSGLPPGATQRLEIIARRERLRLTTDVRPMSADDQELEVEVQLKPTGSLAGEAELEGQPLAGARAILYMHIANDEGDGGTARTVESVITDMRGRYQFDLVESGREYFVYVHRSDDDFKSTNTVTLAPGSAEELPLISFQSLNMWVSGVVVDPDGNPVEGAKVSASNRDTGEQFNAGLRQGNKAMVSDKDGRFTLRMLPNVPLELLAYIPPPEGESRIRFPARVEAEPGQTDVRIVLDPKLVRGR
jgi:hypothetical protein